jgi:hypothetical protein
MRDDTQRLNHFLSLLKKFRGEVDFDPLLRLRLAGFDVDTALDADFVKGIFETGRVAELVALYDSSLNDLIEELRQFRHHLKERTVWVAIPLKRRALEHLGSSKGECKRLFNDWQQFMSGKRWGLGDRPQRVQVELTTQLEECELSELQKRVLWRATHLAAIEAFADFAIISTHPPKELTSAMPPPAIGCAVATRGVMELAAHYLKGSGDPFDSGQTFAYRDTFGKLDADHCLGLRNLYDEVLKCFKVETYWGAGQPTDQNEMFRVCLNALQQVWNLFNIPSSLPPLEGLGPNSGVQFEKFKLRLVTDPRTSIDWEHLQSQIEITNFGFEWLIYLWQGRTSNSPNKHVLLACQVNDTTGCWDITQDIKNLKYAKSEFERSIGAIRDLLRAFCLASNLTPLVAGAIARELHLHVEELTVQAGLCERHELTKKGKDETDEEFKNRKLEQDDKSLKCLEAELQELVTDHLFTHRVPDLNLLRVRLQDVLASFAHPGWLIRTETAKFRTSEEPQSWSVKIDSSYSSPFYDRDYRYVDQRQKNPFYVLFRKNLPPSVEEAMSGMQVPRSDGANFPGSAFEIPFAAVELCIRALQRTLRRDASTMIVGQA